MKTLLFTLVMAQATLARAQPCCGNLSLPLIDTTPPTDHWRLVIDADGQIYRERRHSRLGYLIGGLSLFVTPYAIGGALSRSSMAFLPVVGSFVAMGSAPDFGHMNALMLSGIAQIAGTVLVIIGATAAGKNHIERRKVALRE